MKTKVKRMLALCLALLTILSAQSFAAAALAADVAADVADGETESASEVPDRSAFDALPGDTVVAKLYICSQQLGFGHSWIYIESMFDGDMPVGCYNLKAFQGVSMGTFAVTRADGPGLYYNVEAYCANKWGLSSQAWLGTEITKDQLVAVSDKIMFSNRWDFFRNCTFFAAGIWNTVSDKRISAFIFPMFIKMQILNRGGSRDVEMKPVEASDCFKQKGNGTSAVIEQVSERSLTSKLF